MRTKKITEGSTIRLKPGTVVGAIPEGRKNHRTAKVRSFLSDIEGGIFTDRDLRGCRYWNISDVELVE